jgi:rod shape-determining protein MreD
MNPIIKYVLQFSVLILLQVLVVDQISLGDASQFIIPSVYFLFVLMLPLTISNGLLMFLAFSIGMMVDIFKSTPGMNASAMVVLAYSRPYLLKLIEPREGFDVLKSPSVYSMRKNVYLLYASLAALVFHLWYFMVEVMRFSDFHVILLKTLCSSIISVLLIILIQYLTVKRK